MAWISACYWRNTAANKADSALSLSMSTIKIYDSREFTERYMSSPELGSMLKGNFRQFFIVKVEQMYRLVKGTVPASRSTGHSFIYITEGEAVMTIGSRQYTTRQGELLLVPAGQVFSFKEGDVNKGYLCHFNDQLLAGVFRKKEHGFLTQWGRLHQLHPDRRTAQFILQLFKRLFYEYSTHGMDRLDILQSCLFALLCELGHACQPAAGIPSDAETGVVRQFSALVLLHFRTSHLVKDYAALLHVTPNHLNKRVRAVTGRSPARWIDEAIIQEAKVLLRQTGSSISEVAAEVGFEDQSYFARLFRKHEGVTPSRWRQMIEKS
jgi:AraC family transcriptional activator of pobA